MEPKLIKFALNFLRANIEDPEVEAALAFHLGLTKNEEDYDGEKYDVLLKIISAAQMANS